MLHIAGDELLKKTGAGNLFMIVDKPKAGKIAVKVINHYGGEVLKVFAVKRIATRLTKSPEIPHLFF